MQTPPPFNRVPLSPGVDDSASRWWVSPTEADEDAEAEVGAAIAKFVAARLPTCGNSPPSTDKIRRDAAAIVAVLSAPPARGTHRSVSMTRRLLLIELIDGLRGTFESITSLHRLNPDALAQLAHPPGGSAPSSS